MRVIWQRETTIGVLLGAAAGFGFLALEGLAGAAAVSEWHRWARLGYVVVMAVVGALIGNRYGRVCEQAVTDPLTGLFNRRYFHTVASSWLARARRNREQVSLLIMDIDNFKGINDRMGHHEGDRILRTVADAIMETCRGSDVAVRWGGEEFAVLLPETDGEGAAQAAERIYAAVHRRADVTLSYGIATFPDVDEEALVTTADRRMYENKHDKSNPSAPCTAEVG